ncbi:beta-galactosidase [Alicyclobacillus fastidiosus]|uniref:Beta-galactosidase n=1 Tax=Alicyclobacillus fastidiosus TaxID=392011 RepID=A0ABY6ZNC4_9BACL|nr:beta-galactosidase [Alicyclobacillus fastidiosus]WAH43942.1 beta-galactosidase [Alicyclobacillus fastidiosus]GMA60197.1 hypothetical protein GCM10025859_06370 [Alicyclobacillus fastidiosus]
MRRISEDVLFVSSLFYFRLPKHSWLDRLQKVKAAGYNAIDVYIPWNFHEPIRGQYRFTDEADIETFLDLAAETELRVIARPGPYICSEWDGGAIPAWLYNNDQLQLRQNDALWLAEVKRWYDIILPKLLPYQLTKGGPVIALQVENELDFYPCRDVKGYIEALFDMVRKSGFDIPITACIGQGDILGATGESDRVIPMANIYPSKFDDPNLESLLEQYTEYARSHDFVPMTMETNRDILTLSRLVASGFQAMSPYLMTSGVHIGPWNGINNWGAYPSYITTDYDFGGMISADGTLRESFYENRILTSIVKSLEEIFVSGSAHTLSIEKQPDAAPSLMYRQVTAPQGSVTFAFNLSDAPVEEHVEIDGYQCSLVVPAKMYTTVATQVFLGQADHKYRFSTSGNVIRYKQDDDNTYTIGLTSFSDIVDFTIHTDTTLQGLVGDVEVDSCPGAISFRMSLEFGMSILTFSDGTKIKLVTAPMKDAGRLWDIQNGGLLLGPRYVKQNNSANEHQVSLQVDVDQNEVFLLMDTGDIQQLELTAGCGNEIHESITLEFREHESLRMILEQESALSTKNPISMEEANILAGRAMYQSTIKRELNGIKVSGAADLVWVFVNGDFQGCYAPGGNGFECSFGKSFRGENELTIVTESWGHTNFHDTHAPSLRTGARKGILGTVSTLPLGEPITGWVTSTVKKETGSSIQISDSESWPILCSRGNGKRIRGEIKLSSADCRDIYLKLTGENGRADVYLNGVDIGRAWFGPHLNPRLVGGRANRLWLRPDLLNEDGTGEILIDFISTDDGIIHHPTLEREDQLTKTRDIPLVLTSDGVSVVSH